MTSRRFPLGLTITTAIAFAILCGLGGWQLKRLAWKQDLLARIEARQHAPPVPFNVATKDLWNAEFTRTFIDCPGLARAPFVEVYSIRGGRAGSRLLSLCLRGKSLPVIVDRGFVPDTVSGRPAVDANDQTVVRVQGLLRGGERPGAFTPKPEGRTFYITDLHAIGRALGARRGGVAIYLLAAETSTNPDFKSLRPSPLPPAITNRHLEYALTWFGLAGALAAVYAALLRRRLKA